MLKYLKESSQKAQEKRKEYHLFNRILLVIKDPMIYEEINIIRALMKIENSIPAQFFEDVEEIFIGFFKELQERSVDAVFKDGAIYVSNAVKTEERLIGNIIHEAMHSVEIRRAGEIYADGRLEKEYLGKKTRVLDMLKNDFNIPKRWYRETDYSEGFDEFLYKDLGYNNLVRYTLGLFLTPYSVTSLREYFAVGCEQYFFDDRNYVKDVCPILLEKIEELDG